MSDLTEQQREEYRHMLAYVESEIKRLEAEMETAQAVKRRIIGELEGYRGRTDGRLATYAETMAAARAYVRASLKRGKK